MSEIPTWQQLVKAEPELEELLEEAQCVDGSDSHFCANRVWYMLGGLKENLCDLVGWTARRSNPILKTSAAYDVAYKKIYAALPDCRDCWCLQCR